MRQQAPVAGAVSAAFSPMLATSAALIVLPQSRRPRAVRLIGWVSERPHRHAERRFAFALGSRCVTAGVIGVGTAGQLHLTAARQAEHLPPRTPVTGQRLRRKRR